MSVQIDCDTCAVRGLACSDCVISVLLGPPAGAASPESPDTLADEEVRALDVLAQSGLVPPLRMLPPLAAPAGPARPASSPEQPTRREASA